MEQRPVGFYKYLELHPEMRREELIEKILVLVDDNLTTVGVACQTLGVDYRSTLRALHQFKIPIPDFAPHEWEPWLDRPDKYLGETPVEELRTKMKK